MVLYKNNDNNRLLATDRIVDYDKYETMINFSPLVSVARAASLVLIAGIY